MRFDFTAEQIALRDSVARLFEAESSPEQLRALWDSETGRNPALWEGLGGIGVTGILIPEEFGGLGGDETDVCLVLEEAGKFCVPDAILEGCFLAPTVILQAGSQEQKSTWLPGIASGDIRATVALSGTTYVPDAHISDLVILERENGFLVLERGEFSASRVTSMDQARRLFDVQPAAGAGTTMDADAQIREAVHSRQHVGSAAVLNGLAERMVERTVDYTKIRKQFGRIIGSFQAVKHQLAQAVSLNALSLQATRTAMYRVAHGEDNAIDSARLARICAVEAEFESNRVALQLHGGIGFTWEHDLQNWLKRGKVLEQAHGGHVKQLALAGAAGVAAAPSNAV